jgi:hypothetical protein
MFAHGDRTFFYGIFFAAISLLLSMIGWLTFWQTGLFSTFQAIVGVGGVVAALGFLAFATWDFRGYKLGTAVNIPKTRAVAHIKKFGRSIDFNEFLPAPNEMDFEIKKDAEFARDTYMRSESFDNYLIKEKPIPFILNNRTRFGFFSNDPEVRRLQLTYLIPRVRNSIVIPTTNDTKCGLRMELGPPVTNAEFYKVGYFDSLITNEFFRSEIFQTNKLIESGENEIHNKSIDLTAYFPVFQTGSASTVRLPPLHQGGAANHLGTTPLILTKDNRVLLFRQGDTAIDRGSVVCSGSGSLDWRDLKHAAASDLLGAARVGMAREFCEEASAHAAYRRMGIRGRDSRIADAASRTLVTGFFRWVNRCGKPEFIGAARTSFNYTELPPDDFEVTTFELETIRIFRMEDFGTLMLKLEQQFRKSKKLRMGLSSYLALRRLAEIASYRESVEAEKRSIFDQARTRLELD